MPYLLKNKPAGGACILLMMMLGLAILVQMLGGPVTLLNQAAAINMLGGTSPERLSVLSSLMRTKQAVPVVETHVSVYGPVLALVPFHPPLSDRM